MPVLDRAVPASRKELLVDELRVAVPLEIPVAEPLLIAELDEVVRSLVVVNSAYEPVGTEAVAFAIAERLSVTPLMVKTLPDVLAGTKDVREEAGVVEGAAADTVV